MTGHLIPNTENWRSKHQKKLRGITESLEGAEKNHKPVISLVKRILHPKRIEGNYEKEMRIFRNQNIPMVWR